MLKHLMVLGGLMLSGIVAGIPAAFVGTDLFYNKVLLGQKLQPLQATVLFVGDEYVTNEARQLGRQGTSAPSNIADNSHLNFPSGVDNSAQSDTVSVLTQEQRKTVRNRLIIWGIVGSLFGALFGAGFWYYNVWIWQSVNQNLRVAMVERAESLSLSYHDNARVGDAIFRVYQDSAMIVNLIQSGIFTPINAALSLIIGLFVVAMFDPWFTLVVVVVVFPVVWLSIVSTPRIRRRVLANRIANSDLTSRAQEVFAAVKVVKANRAESRVFDRFSADSIRALDAAYFLRLDMALITLVVGLLAGSTLILSEYIMVSWIIDQRDTFLGALVASLIGFAVWNYGAYRIAMGQVGGFAFGMRGLLGIWMRMQDLFLALERAFFLLDIEPEVDDPENPLPFPIRVARVRWRNVVFGYNPDQPILRGIDLEAGAGSITAIVGATGSGKSTLMSLLLRLYDPNSGRIEVNDVDLKDMAVDDVRRHAAIALQKNVLFANTIANNIGFGNPTAEPAAIETAATIACAHDFIEAQSKGYNTELGERGAKLSAGQRQRLSIARAVLRDAPILILDEPTASLDAQTEQRVLTNLTTWGKDKVIFLITHRLSTIRNADQIAFLEDGRIVEKGSHDELTRMENGRYRAFVEAETVETSP
jgi:ABC-type multidrug transport system fused ATPase/permease subunit